MAAPNSTSKMFLSRRLFLSGAGGIAAVGSARADPPPPAQRRDQAYRIRRNTARAQRDLAIPADPSKGDEERYPNKIGMFTKGLPHNQLGEVDLNAYNAFIGAMSSGWPKQKPLTPLWWWKEAPANAQPSRH